MFVKLLRSVAIGLIVGAILLAAMPSLRKINTLTAPQFDSADETPASYNPAVCTLTPRFSRIGMLCDRLTGEPKRNTFRCQPLPSRDSGR